MAKSSLAVLFAGQGKLEETGFAASEHVLSHAKDILNEIDSVSANSLGITVSGLFVNESSRQQRDPVNLSHEALQLALFGASLAVYESCADLGIQPDVIVGHSFGEIAALVSAGALSVRQGASVVCDRAHVLRTIEEGRGAMALLNTDGASAQAIVDKVGSDFISVAVENSPAETVIAGKASEILSALEIATEHAISFSRLACPYPLHCPALMADAAVAFLERLSGLKRRKLKVPVFSPYLGRYFDDDDDLPSILVHDLYRPLPFAQAIRCLYEDGVQTFLECGLLAGFGRHITATVAECEVLRAGMGTPSMLKLTRNLKLRNNAAAKGCDEGCGGRRTGSCGSAERPSSEFCNSYQEKEPACTSM